VNLQRVFSTVNIAAVVMAIMPLTIAPPAVAQATVTGPCLAMVVNTTIPATVSGENPLFGGTAVSPTTLPGLTGDQCHQKAEQAFNANAAWSNPAQFCARFPDGKTHKIEALEILTNVGGPWHGHTGGYNLVAGYTVTCAGPINVTQLKVPTVVPGPF
jgi:hypothetical protein